MPNPYRMYQAEDIIQRCVAKLLDEKCRDPRIGRVTITSVEISNKYAHAKLWVNIAQDSDAITTIKLLNKASGFFRYELAKNTYFRGVPKLRFVPDTETYKMYETDFWDNITK